MVKSVVLAPFGKTVIVTVTGSAHSPTSGVKVYVVVVVLSKAGDQEPGIPLLEIVGNGDKGLPEHIGVTAGKVGVTAGMMVKSKVSLPVGLVAILKLFSEIKGPTEVDDKTTLVNGVTEKYPKDSVSVATVRVSIAPSE